MKPIGGFFELELPGTGRPWHGDAIAMTSGRSALRVILETISPRRVLFPFYTCDTAVLPARRCGMDVEYYPLSETLEPELLSGPKADECLVYINYFGMCGPIAERLAGTFGARAIIDDTQAFFARGYQGAWSFNSARKYFGVPDGGYLYPATPLGNSFPPNQEVCTRHLVARLNGALQTAFAEYQASEACITDAPRGMSALTMRLLAAVDYRAVADRRRDNYRRLDAHFAGRNQIALRCTDDQVPFSYPLSLGRPITRERLWERLLFVPQFWPEVITREGGAFTRERALASDLLPLPIDHRYDAADMELVIERFDEVAAG